MTSNAVTIEHHGQIVKPCTIIRALGPYRRVIIPVEGGQYRIRWVPRWKILQCPSRQ